ncbi:MAG: DNA-directed DNA polymerase [Aigarchaeota archaeon]|nr:DNA-directed DNA polymerase [Aigarchaeota archaeon]MDW7986173.1 DNA-directed DNA polymerase [Nitrososphaerota archaeon]
MNEVLWLLDIAVEVEDGKPTVWLWCKDQEGKTYIVKQRYSPSFYIIASKHREVVEYLVKQGFKIEEVGRKIRGRDVKAIKVYVDVEDVESLAKKIAKELKDIELYEEDVRPSVKYLIENNLRPSGGIRVKGNMIRDDLIRIVEADKVEYVKDVIPPPLHVLSFDVIYYSESGSPKPERDPVILISLATLRGRRTQLYGDEEKILREFLKIIEEEDPDIIVGFSSNRLHWSYLVERVQRYGLRLFIGRLGSEPHTSIHGHISIRGRLNIDLEDMARDIPELTVETLEEFTAYLGLDQEFDRVEEWEIAEIWRRDSEKVKRYSLQRVEAMLKCYEALRDYIFSISELTGMPVDYVLTASTGFRVENYLMYLAVERGELIPKKPEISHVSYVGGLVKSPKPGLHEDVAIVDFRSMYPSLMIKYNISFDTLSEDGEYISPNNFRFKKEPEGFLPHALKTLIAERRQIQEKLKKLDEDSVEARVLNARQKAIKVISNAIYGYTGWIGARWYTREVAEATTSWGRHVIMESIKKAEELGMKIIYSDTDSLFLQNYYGRLEEFLKWVEEDLGLEAKVEKIYKRVIFTEAKKKYAGIKEDLKIDIIGLEAVRGDWSLIAREAQEETVKILLMTGDIGEALKTVRNYIKKIMDREVEMRELVIWRQITKPLDEYEATQPHIVIARQLIKEGWRIQPGDKVGYIVIQGSGPLYKRVKPYFKVSKDEVDWEYYIDKQILSACIRVLEPLGVKLEDLKKTGGATLTDFF